MSAISSSLFAAKTRRGLLFRVARASLLILTPIIWIAGIMGAFFHHNVVIMNHRIDDTRSFIYCVLVAPIAAVICGFIIWLFFIAPFQFIGWILNHILNLLGRIQGVLLPARKSSLDSRT